MNKMIIILLLILIITITACSDQSSRNSKTNEIIEIKTDETRILSTLIYRKSPTKYSTTKIESIEPTITNYLEGKLFPNITYDRHDLLAFTIDSDIYVTNSLGEYIQNVTNTITKESNPSWSPNGFEISYLSENDENNSINIINILNGNITTIIDEKREIASPKLSPDGKYLAFILYEQGIGKPPALFTIEKNGSNLKMLPMTNVRDLRNLSWSPDGKYIAFDGIVEYQEIWQLFELDMATYKIKRITLSDQIYSNMFPAWSPDGEWIVFNHEFEDGNKRERGDELFVVRHDGKDMRRLIFNEMHSIHPTWKHDANIIAFEASIYPGCQSICNSQIFTIKSDGTGLTRLFISNKSVEEPIWQW